MRRLIINADDLGLTDGINRAIVEAHADGVVTSATLMASGPAKDGALHLARAHPGLSVGCHVVLVDGSPILNGAQVMTLLEGKSPKAAFHQSLGGFAARALSGGLNGNEIEAEAAAQIRTLQQHGLSVTHFDTHKHTHIFPPVLRALLRAAKACGVGALRNPFGRRLPLSLRDLRARPHLWKRFLEVSVLGTFSLWFRRAVQEYGLLTPDGSFGVLSTGALDFDLFTAIVDCIPDGTWEFVCHPGYNDSELANIRTRLRESRQKELDVLTSAAAREALDRRGIQLISYREV